MVVPITTSPLFVDALAWPLFFTGNFFIGPWLVGTDLYAALQEIGGLDTRIQVVKSTDSGATWARMDDGGGTSIGVNGVTPLFTDSVILWFFGAVFPFDTQDVFFEDEQSFDFSSDTFQSLVADADPDGYAGVMRAQMRSDGSVVTVFGSGSGGAVRIFSGGGYGSKFVTDATAGTYGIVVDSSDVAHVLFADFSAFPVVVYSYRTITGSGTVSSSVTIADVFDPTSQPVADSGNLCFPFIDFSGAHPRVKIEYATGATSDPNDATWTQYPVWTGTLDSDSDDDSTFATMDGADLLVFWINTTAAGIARVYYAKFNGSGFDAPVVFYDSSLHPPAGATQDPTMRGLSVVKLSGSWVGIVAMDIDGTGNQTFYLQAGGAPTSGYRNRIVN